MNVPRRILYSILMLMAILSIAACKGRSGKITIDSTTTTITPVPATHAISGVVSGTTTSGVSISLSGDMVATTTTNSLGTYVFSDIPDGSYTLTPTFTNYRFAPISTSVAVSGTDVAGVNFSDVGDFEISGKVSGQAIQGVSIVLTGSTNTVTSTDANGNFRFSGLDSGSYSVALGLSGYVFVPASRGILISNTSVTSLVFASIANSGPFYTISGTVSGATSSGVIVSVVGPTCASTVTDTNGKYDLGGLPSGTYIVRAWKDCYSAPALPYIKSITTSSLASVDITTTAGPCSLGYGVAVAASSSVSGTVSGAVQQRVTMVLTGDACSITTTDVNGFYQFIYLVGGYYTVTPAIVGHTFSPSSRSTWVGSVTGFDFSAL